MSTPETLSKVSHNVTQQQLIKYADASGDYNPLHLDEKFAAATPYGRTIAHGMLVLAFVSEAMVKSFGLPWMCGGKMKAKFRSPVYPGDTVTTTGTLKSTTDANAIYDVIVRKQDGTEVLTAETTVPITS